MKIEDNATRVGLKDGQRWVAIAGFILDSALRMFRAVVVMFGPWFLLSPLIKVLVIWHLLAPEFGFRILFIVMHVGAILSPILFIAGVMIPRLRRSVLSLFCGDLNEWNRKFLKAFYPGDVTVEPLKNFSTQETISHKKENCLGKHAPLVYKNAGPPEEK